MMKKFQFSYNVIKTSHYLLFKIAPNIFIAMLFEFSETPTLVDLAFSEQFNLM